ncbi:transcription factor HES-2-like [Dunckerocampus dactyliophorus]|uniref:transcription factor HES-2-like n=1 Tax=Dunckerocampus dactyliophorus TaxID=161453 RepID=UPI002405FEC0|nr:transcription factor HES-2-like [Dunckerocampus dactyliophorus]
MAPTITAAVCNSQQHVTLTHKLRKPLVEKLRRERINSSIEQLKSLLPPEFLTQQPDSKLEKADVLEMTVCFLTQLQQQRGRLLKHFQQLPSSCEEKLGEEDLSPLSSAVHSSITKEASSGDSTPWRPWSTQTDCEDHVGQMS